MITTYTVPDFPALVPAPVFCETAEEPVICLDGIWDFLNTTDYEQIAVQTKEASVPWESIRVPSWVSPYHRKGFVGAYLYRRQVTVTPQMAASRTVLRMEGVNGFCTVYVNQTPVAFHQNGLVSWNVEITEQIRGLDSFTLTVAVDERQDKVSSFSHGGLFHSVFLYLLPSSYIDALHTTTTFDASFQDAVWRLDFGIRTAAEPNDLHIAVRLLDPAGNEVPDGCTQAPAACGHSQLSLPITAPLSWDAEHPRLYTVELSLYCGDTLLERVCKAFGFRQIDRKGNRLFVNGKEVKLRGSCRHEITAKNGRCLTKELIEEDVRLFKEANCNYIRTSHYPPSEYFLDLCDRYGIYVEDEMALAFIARTLDYTQQDPSQTTRYLSHFAELAARDYSHPSVIIWSLCNESFGGLNFDLLNQFAKKVDPTRVTKFSYPMTIREEYEPIDIWSIHYSNYENDLAEQRDNVSVGGAYDADGNIAKDKPILHDEFVHVPCYNRTEQRRDQNVRVYWGESIARFWDKIWNTAGALGGAIWAGIDETDVYVGGIKHLEWGIFDVWRRRKPEHFETRKAYSPVILYGVDPLRDEIAKEHGRSFCLPCLKDNMLCLDVENRFCHTDLSETTVRGWYFKAGALTDASIEDCCAAKENALSFFEQNGPVLSPFAFGKLAAPCRQDADYLYLEWTDASSNCVDEFLIPLAPVLSAGRQQALPEILPPETGSPACAPLLLSDDEQTLTISGNSLLCRIDKSTGLFLEVSRGGVPAVTGGPWLHTPYWKLPEWKLCDLSYVCDDCGSDITITAKGSYPGKLDITFTYRIHPDGQICISYAIDKILAALPHQIKLRVGVDCGGLDELGITLETAPGMDTLSWNRTGAWSVYPRHSIGRNRGTAARNAAQLPFGTPPVCLWKDDSRHDILNGPYDPGICGTGDFCSLKADLTHAVLSSSAHSAASLCVTDGSRTEAGITSDAKKAQEKHMLHLRAEAVPSSDCILSCMDPCISWKGTWYPMHDSDYQSSGKEMWSCEAGASAVIPFTGIGIVWYAPVNVNYGYAAVYIDGVKQDVLINQRVDGVDFAGSSAGFDKKHHYPVYSVSGLENTAHTLTIEVLGQHASDSNDSYIVLESFVVLKPNQPFPVRLHLLQDYGYPHIAWGNRHRPAIIPHEGDSGSVTISL